MPHTAFSQFMAALALGHAWEAAGNTEDVRALLDDVYSERCHKAKHHKDAYQVRVNLQKKPDAASYAGWITSENPSSGPYQGTSFVWFPGEQGSVVVLVIGTDGFGQDTHILGRPGHARRLRALARLHAGRTWIKPDPLDLNSVVPDSVAETWPTIAAALKSYQHVIYAATPVRGPDDASRVEDLLDLFFSEHNTPLTGRPGARWEERKQQIAGSIFPAVEEDDVLDLLRERRFVVLEGPPGTGKTRMAFRIADRIGSSTRVQFHPARTYEDFVIGLFPRPTAEGLAFDVRPGELLRANERARERDHVLVIDEINRADLARVLGEAVALFEPGEPDREVSLPHTLPDGNERLRLSRRLSVLATRNTADRTIARMDLAIRRRFAFLSVWPDLRAVEAQGIDLARDLFAETVHTFAEYADDETLRLVPGHAYFLDPRPDLDSARRGARVARRLELELVPLLIDYLEERLCGAASEPIAGLVDRIESTLRAAR